ncbi:MAG: hypothetical protein ACRD4U_06750 [Candidatus Acidiferrales bacterium]
MRNRILILGVVLLLAATVAIAGGEQSKGAKMDPEAKAAQLQKDLGLTDAQTQQVQTVLEDTHKRFEALKTQNLAEDALKAEKTKIKAEQDAKLKGIFTSEQWAKFEELRKPKQEAKKPQ